MENFKTRSLYRVNINLKNVGKDVPEPTCAHFITRQMLKNQHWRHPCIECSEPSVRERKRRLIAATFRKQQQKGRVKSERSHGDRTHDDHKKKITLVLTHTNRFRSVHWRLTGQSSGCVSGGICAMETGELAEPRGLNVNCGLRHFIRMPLSRAAMQPSC